MTKVNAKIISDIIEHNKMICNKEDLATLVFFRPNSVRLSYTGYTMLKKIYSEHKFPLQPLSNMQLIQLYRTSTYPYYIGGEYISLFDGEDAFAIKLFGSIEDWLDAGT